MTAPALSSEKLHKAFSLIRQPDSITCGPTCLVMVARALTILNGKTPLAVHGQNGVLSGYANMIVATGKAMGTCFEFGTRHIEMAAGLRLFGLPVVRSIGGVDPENDTGEPAKLVRLDAEATLSEALHEGNAVILRTLWHGCKHWMLLYSDGEKLFLLDPCSSVPAEIDQELMREIVNAWAKRGYDGFSVSLRAGEPHIPNQIMSAA